jgi:hypothetical protein
MVGRSGAAPGVADEAGPRVSHLPRLRPRAGFWSDVGWTLLFFVSPGNLLLFFIVWALSSLVPWFLGLLPIPLLPGVLIAIVALYVTAWYMSIIPETAAGEDDLPTFAFGGGFFEDVIRPALAYFGTFIVLLAPAFVYAMCVAPKDALTGLPDPTEIDVLTWLRAGDMRVVPLIGLGAFGIFVWPIALMCVAMSGLGALLRIDLLVRAIAATLPAYTAIFVMVAASMLLPAIITGAVVAAAPAGGAISKGGLALEVLASALWVYFTIVTMRLIGLYYLHFKARFPWDWE